MAPSCSGISRATISSTSAEISSSVCAAQTEEEIRAEVDEMVCLETTGQLGAIGFWYYDFEQVTDEEALELIESARSG